MTLTPARIALLRLLHGRPHYRITALADKIAPRLSSTGFDYGWTPQGAARWGGGYVKPLAAAGLVEVNSYVSSGVGHVSITDKGRRLLADLDAAAERAALDLAIEGAA